MSSADDEAGRTTAWPTQSFRAGDHVGGRYRVTRFLGRGAMGEVYAVRDEELGSDVALKLLRLDVGDDAESRERFKREILLARRVSHPNVCRIYDLGAHELPTPGGEPRRAIAFLTMELLDGETLVDRIARRGPYSEEEAAPIVAQLARALAAAHEAGVVHRDFKSSNILLVEAPGGPRAVITDFGLAREQVPDPRGVRLTATGGVLGTPAYMSPEQVEGKPVDARSDLYAFGVVIYEMLTGHFPFESDSPLGMALKRLQEPPAPPESFRPDLSGRARAVLRRALARAPEERFTDALELSRAFSGEVAVAPPRRRRRGTMAAALVAAAALALALAWQLGRRAPPPAGVGSGARRPAIAVLPLRNATGSADSAWLSIAFAEMLTTELASGDALRAVPGETVARAARDLDLAPADALAPGTLRRLRRAAGADLAVVGSYVALGDPGRARLRLDLRLQGADGGADLARSVEGAEEDLFALVARAGAELREALGVASAGAPEGAATRALLPRGEPAAKLYTEGLEALRAGNPLLARERLSAALAEDREAPLAWSALSETWSLLGWSERAREAAREAYDRRAALPRVDALLVEGRFRLASGEWDAAIDIHRALWRLFGDDPEHGLRLAHALLEADRAGEALEVVAELRDLPPPAGEDARIDLYEARAADGLSEPRRQLEAAERAAAKARESGARSLLARALYERGLATRKLGEPAAAEEALEAARRLAAETGDRSLVATVLLSRANLVRADGQLDEAAALYAETRATFAALGNRQREARAELSQGLVVSQQGDLEAALGLYESALGKLREVGDRRGAAAALSNIGTLLYEQGDLAGALERHEAAMAEFRALGDESRLAVSLQNQAQIRLDRGDLAGAERDLAEELELARRAEDKTAEGYALKGIADLLYERGRFDEAAARYAEAGARFDAAGQTTWKLYAEMGGAILDRERGAAATAAVALARLEEEFARAGMSDDRDEAALERLRAELAARGAEAGAGAAELLGRARRSAVQRLRLLERWARAELLAARGDALGAARVLDEQRVLAARGGLALIELAARAELARAAAGRREAGAAQRVAEALAEAERLGAGRVARRLGGTPH